MSVLSVSVNTDVNLTGPAPAETFDTVVTAMLLHALGAAPVGIQAIAKPSCLGLILTSST